MDSPYACRLRLAQEVKAIRQEVDLTSDQLAKKIGSTRLRISKLENAGSRPDLAEVWKILEAGGVEEGTDRWRTIIQLARSAGERGWWDSTGYAGMGDRQAKWADLESGAARIEMYDPTLIPGLLQTEAYYRALSEAVADEGDFDTDALVRGRLRRQQEREKSETRLEVALEEMAIRRLVVPAEVMVEQLRALGRMAGSETVTVRIVPADAQTVGARPPRAAFSIVRYQNLPEMSPVVVEGIVEDDDILTDAAQVASYTQLLSALVEAALSPEDSAAYINHVADTLSNS